MPEYLMRCENGHEIWIKQPMLTKEKIICVRCGSYMWRKPLPPTVNWNGLKPSQGEHSDEFKYRLNNIERVRDETDEKYRKRDAQKAHSETSV